MPKEKVSKSTTQTTTTSQSGQPVKQKVKTSKPKKEVVSATKVVEEKSEVPVVVEQSTETDVVVGDNLECLMQDFVAKIQQVSLQTTSLKQEFKVLEKKVLQRLKQAEKASKKKKRLIESQVDS